MPRVEYGDGLAVDWTETEYAKIKRFRREAGIRRITEAVWGERHPRTWERAGITKRSIADGCRLSE